MRNLVSLDRGSIYRDTFESIYDTMWEFAPHVVVENGSVEEIDPLIAVSYQEEVDEDYVDKIIESGNYDGILAIRFEDATDEVIIVDGNHRASAAIKAGVETVKMIVLTIPEPFLQ